MQTAGKTEVLRKKITYSFIRTICTQHNCHLSSGIASYGFSAARDVKWAAGPSSGGVQLSAAEAAAVAVFAVEHQGRMSCRLTPTAWHFQGQV